MKNSFLRTFVLLILGLSLLTPIAGCTIVDTPGTDTTVDQSIDTPEESENKGTPVSSTAEALEIIKQTISGGETKFFVSNHINSYEAAVKDSPIVIQFDSVGMDGNGEYFLFHEYEYDADQALTEQGPYITHNWYRVSAASGEVSTITEPDASSRIRTAQAAVDTVKEFLIQEKGYIFSDDSSEPLSYSFLDDSRFLISFSHLGTDSKGSFYIIREFENVVDDPATGTGHIVTHHWYNVYLQNVEVLVDQPNKQSPMPAQDIVTSPQQALDMVKAFIEQDDTELFEAENPFPLTIRYTGSDTVIQYYSAEKRNGITIYTFHEFANVVDDPDTGDSHTATSNWYEVNSQTGTVEAMF